MPTSGSSPNRCDFLPKILGERSQRPTSERLFAEPSLANDLCHDRPKACCRYASNDLLRPMLLAFRLGAPALLGCEDISGHMGPNEYDLMIVSRWGMPGLQNGDEVMEWAPSLVD